MEKGILVVSFGTSHMDTMEKTITVIEREIARRFPEWRVYRAFTSRMIVRKLKRTENMEIDTVEEALKRMAADGISEVIVQPTHIINGIENDRMMENLMEHMSLFNRIRVGKPLLSSVDDYKKAIHGVMSEVGLETGEMLVLMGHGTDHHANSAYPTLSGAGGHGGELPGTEKCHGEAGDRGEEKGGADAFYAGGGRPCEK